MTLWNEQTPCANDDDDFGAITHRIKDGQGLAALWNALPGGALCTPFQSPGFMDAFVNALVPARCEGLNICEVRPAGSEVPAALFPYVIHNRGPVRIASFPDFGVADQVTPVISGGRTISAKEFASIWQAFVDTLHGVDLVDIDKVPPRIGDRPNPLHRERCAAPSGEMVVLDLSEASITHWKKKSVFREARAKARKLSAQGVEFFFSRDPRDCLAAFDLLRKQRFARFKAVGRYNSLEEQPGYADFYQHLVARASPGGPVLMFGLKAGDEVISAALAFADEDLVNGVLISIGDEKWHRCSPGIVLLVKIIEWAEASGLKEVCFGTGMQDYKQRFGGDVMQLYRISQPLTARGSAFLVARRMINAVRHGD